jgi:hypothetical protein
MVEVLRLDAVRVVVDCGDRRCQLRLAVPRLRRHAPTASLSSPAGLTRSFPLIPRTNYGGQST